MLSLRNFNWQSYFSIIDTSYVTGSHLAFNYGIATPTLMKWHISWLSDAVWCQPKWRANLWCLCAWRQCDMNVLTDTACEDLLAAGQVWTHSCLKTLLKGPFKVNYKLLLPLKDKWPMLYTLYLYKRRQSLDILLKGNNMYGAGHKLEGIPYRGVFIKQVSFLYLFCNVTSIVKTKINED